jgi:hypothetical protein
MVLARGLRMRRRQEMRGSEDQEAVAAPGDDDEIVEGAVLNPAAVHAAATAGLPGIAMTAVEL